MDLLVTKSNQEIRLSKLGFYNIAISESSPTLNLDKRSVKGRNGTIYDGLTYDAKEIVVTGRVSVASIQAQMQLEDDVKGLLLDSEPFYITKMRPVVEQLYDFEVPGQKTGDISLLGAEHIEWHYRHKVTASNPTFSFIGKSSQGLKYNFSVTFTTAEMPFGETKPRSLSLSGGSIPYSGNEKYSQLEYPYMIVLTASGGRNNFYLTIGNRRYEFSQESEIANGTVFKISGNSTTMQVPGSTVAVNVTDKTNYEYFVLEPSINHKIQYKTNFPGTIRIEELKEIYR